MTVASKKMKRALPWLIAAGFIAVLALIFSQLEAAPSDRNPQNIDPDWAYLSGDPSGRLTYADDRGVTSRWGVDISVYQGEVDFAALKEAGVEFAILRLGYRGRESGELNTDSYFAQNVERAAAVGMPIGVYFYSQATTETEAAAEADYVAAQLRGIALDYPVVYDQESYGEAGSRTVDLTGEQATANALAFCRRIAADGYTPMIYLNHDWARGMYDLAALDQYLMWFASYDAAPPESAAGFVMWQYSSSGTLPGTQSAHIDLNIWFDSLG